MRLVTSDRGATLVPYQPRGKALRIATCGSEAGAALVTVLLFMVLLFILIATMLVTTGNEIVISGLYRDSVRALELAQAGEQEAVRRIEEGRPYVQGFAGSLDPERIKASVVRQYVGSGATYQKIQVTATAGRTTRTIILMVLQRTRAFPPDLLRAFSLVQQGSARITGDVYVQSYVSYQGSAEMSRDSLIYAGWWIESGGSGSRCYAHKECANKQRPTWYPATRWAVSEITPLGAEIKAQTRNCPEGGGELLLTDTISGVLASDSCTPRCSPVSVQVYVFDPDEPEGSGPPQAVSDALPCGLPYKYVLGELPDDRNPLITERRLVKVIVFEQWFDNYWEFDEAQMVYTKKRSLKENPQFGAIPPFPEYSSIGSNYDRLESGGLITGGDFGCKLPEMQGDITCPDDISRPLLVVLEREGSHIAANLQGHGTIVTRSDLVLSGIFGYWGSILVNGAFTLGAGSPTIHGSLLAEGPLQITGNFTLESGGPSIPVGRSFVIRKAWWER